MSRISGPLLDRIDIQCDIQAVPYSTLKDAQPGESSEAMRERVVRARKVQEQRFAKYNASAQNPIHCNAQMPPKLVREFCQLDAQGDKMLSYAMDKMGLSARAYDRILKVARTIADLDGSETIQVVHISEAISYRSLDREDWAG
jgi:magnesium chelatase family protein